MRSSLENLVDEQQRLTVLYLALFPMGSYFFAVYPEALFLVFAIASIYYARRQSWFLASLLGGSVALDASTRCAHALCL